MTDCRTCELVERRDRHEAPDWDNILRTTCWDVAHSYDTSLPGWLILVSCRHIASVSDLDPEAAAEVGSLQREVSIALMQTVGCEKTYIVQFAEAAEHPHVHFHVIPRMPDLAPEHRGPNVFGEFLAKQANERVPETRMNEIALEVRALLAAMRQ